MKRKRYWSLVAGLLTFFLASVVQGQVSLTVYNQDLGLVKDVRNLNFKKGRNEFKFTDVAGLIDPTSVHFKALKNQDKISILEQNYQYDLVSSEKILDKYINQNINLITEQDKTYKGELLSYSAQNFTLKEPGGAIRILSREKIKDIFFPSLPEGLITRPTLVWLLESEISGEELTEVSYLTKGINWHAEYVAVVDQQDRNLDLSGWVSIDNRSGATYKDANLKLVAGDIHLVTEPKPRPLMLYQEGYAAKEAVQFEEAPFFEYHLYTLSRPATVRDKEIKQLSLFPVARVPIQKIFTYDGLRDNKKIKVNVEFTNSSKYNLGIPLPKGKMRVYKEDQTKALQFVGEDLLDHTPKDEKVKVFLGYAFDILGERVQTEFKEISRKINQTSFEITLKNHKDEDVEVIVIEHFPYQTEWEIVKSNKKYVKKDAGTVEFKLPVEKGAEMKLTYTVEYRY